MSTKVLPFLLLLLLLLPFLHLAAGEPTVYEILPKYGLPQGLLPDNVKSYSLSSNGDFAVELNSPCYVHFSTLAYYNTKITGKLSYGAITDLNGIQAKKLFLWVNLSGMVAHTDKGQIEFQVGFISKSLSISEFQAIPECKSKVAAGKPCSQRGANNLFLNQDANIAEEHFS